LHLRVNTRLADELLIDQPGKVITKGDITDTQIIRVMDKEVGKLPVDVLFVTRGILLLVPSPVND
jgi:hypothetical protein